MSQYTECDFEESIAGAQIERIEIEKVCAAWGNVDEEGKCCEDCGGEWSGGFLLLLLDGRYAYVTGWCDYTGWGCQDGTDVSYYDHKPTYKELGQLNGWDTDPADLNLWLQRTEEP